MFSLSQPVRRAPRSTRARVILTGLALACTWAVLPVSGARAATTEKACPETTLGQPFTSFGDNGYYSLVPGGGFEPGETRWSTAGPAMVAFGSEPYNVSGSQGWFSMALAPGGSTQSPYMCVEPNDRTFRFFLRAAGPSATVSVSLIYKGPLGLPVVVASKNITVGQRLGTLQHAAHRRRDRLERLGRLRTARTRIRSHQGHRPHRRRLPRPTDAAMNQGGHPDSRDRKVIRYCQCRSSRSAASVRRSAWLCILSARGRAASRGACGQRGPVLR